jgi:hypothetical protein
MGNKSPNYDKQIKGANVLQNEGSLEFCIHCGDIRISRYYGRFVYSQSCVIDYTKCCYCYKMNKKYLFI